MKKIILGQELEKWTRLTMYTHDDGDSVDVICEVSDDDTSKWMDSKYDAFYRKGVWSPAERIQHTKADALKAYGYIPRTIIIMECDESEFQNLR